VIITPINLGANVDNNSGDGGNDNANISMNISINGGNNTNNAANIGLNSAINIRIIGTNRTNNKINTSNNGNNVDNDGAIRIIIGIITTITLNINIEVSIIDGTNGGDTNNTINANIANNDVNIANIGSFLSN